jgi:hypothetical protein
MSPVPPWLSSLLEEHLEEIQLLWEVRRSSLRDPAWEVLDLVALDDRIEAHADALELAGERARETLTAGLAGDAVPAFASAFVLLRGGIAQGPELALAALAQAEGPAAAGICEALCHGRLDAVESQLRQWYTSGPAPLAVMAAEVFAFRGGFRTDSRRLPEFLQHADPAVRCAAWRVVALVDG